jgi:DNA primase
MGLIPASFIDELMSRTDIVEVINARVPLKKAGREYKACCPFHGEKTASFTVSPTKQFYHCFGCGAHGTALGFLMDYEHMSFPDAVEELASLAGSRCRASRPRDDRRPTCTACWRGGGPLSQGAQAPPRSDRVSQGARRQRRHRRRLRHRLRARGVGRPAETLRRRTRPPCGGSPAPGLVIEREQGGCYDRFRGRVMFPIRDARGRVIAFGGRVLGAR